MMRPGDKVESYRRLAAALNHLDSAWVLDIIGDGEARGEVEAFFSRHADKVRFHGALDDPALIRARMEMADLFLWPGVGEGVGMVWLEAQAAGMPVVAEAHPSAQELVQNRLAPAEDPVAYATLIRETANDLPARSAAARARVEAKHSLAAAADSLHAALLPLIR